MHVVIRYGGIGVFSQQLEPGEYALGRGKENRIRLHLSMLSRRHGKLYFAENFWWYQDLRPNAVGGRVRFEPGTVVVLGNNLELLAADAAELEATKSDSLSDIRAAIRAARGGLSFPATIAAGAAALALVAGAALAYKNHRAAQPLDVKALLEASRPKIVEFELPRASKGQLDLRKYAGLKDADFTDTLGFCTGFIVAENVVLTANHCIQGSGPFGVFGRFTLKSYDGKLHEARTILGFDAKRDLAFVEVPGLEAYGAFSITTDFTVGEKVYTVGNVAGEGLAVRDGIMANKTPDPDDPSVEYLRYSAPASPGNSGGPLLNDFGEVVALVFARASLSENYNLGTSGKDILAAKARFVDDRSPKTVTLAARDVSGFRPEALLSQLRIPFDERWRDNPDSLRPLDGITAAIQVPATPAAFTTAAVSAMNAAAEAAVGAVAAANDAPAIESWDALVSHQTPLAIPSQFDGQLYAEVRTSSDGSRLEPSYGLIGPPRTAFERKPVSDAAEEPPPIKPTMLTKPTDAFSDFKRSFDTYSYRPGLDGTTATLDAKTILPMITGNDGIIASTSSPYIRPKSQREFVVKALDEELKSSTVADGLGREWRVFTFDLFDRYALETYCLAQPEGHVCLTSSTDAFKSDDLMATGRRNFARYELTPFVAQPSFHAPAVLSAYLGRESAANDPMVKDFTVTTTPSGDLIVSMATFGIAFTHPAGAVPTQIQLSGGLWAHDGKKDWVGVAHQSFFPDEKSPRICDYGVEVRGSNANAMLFSARMHARLIKGTATQGDGLRLADLEVPRDRFFIADVTTSKAGVPLTVYGYCMPLVKAGEGKLEIVTDETKPSKIAFKTL